MMGVYPARGCPFLCNFCSVIKIAGRKVRSQSIETTMASLRAAKAAGVELIIFTSDNLNKYAEVGELMQAMIDERLNLKFFCQCDTQIARQPELVALMAKAKCFQIFVGVETFNRQTLKTAHKNQNHPNTYFRIVELCREHGITSHFSNIIDFPADTEASILENLGILRELGPSKASFYILTPIPGTEQYAEFLDAGLITDKNLDRYDTTNQLWQHPHIDDRTMPKLLFRCYREFNNFSDTLRKSMLTDRRSEHPVRNIAGSFVASGFEWMSGLLHRHPMSGGIGYCRLDNCRDYLPLRRKYFGECLDAEGLVPLPKNLELSSADAAINAKVSGSLIHLTEVGGNLDHFTQ